MSIGQEGPGKQSSGDKRTPLGVYFVTEQLDTSKLHEKYGVTAFVLDYPNVWDLRSRRSGDGILFGLLILALAVLAAASPIRNYDYWWHLATGSWIVDNSAIPHHDLSNLQSLFFQAGISCYCFGLLDRLLF